MISIAGAGVAGLSCAAELCRRGVQVEVFDIGSGPQDNKSSWFAGGMLAPHCEGETAHGDVIALSQGAAAWWSQVTQVTQNGSLVVAPPRDRAELTQFAKRTTGHRLIDGEAIALLEPCFAGQFSRALFYESEAHLNPRQALFDLCAYVQSHGGRVHYNTAAPKRVDVDCRGYGDHLPDLRPVRGEMALIESSELNITRVVRLLHPRIPFYLVPRGHGVYMIGATMIESPSMRPISVRSLLDLLAGASVLHPSLGEATVIETGVGLRPAFSDNRPTVIQKDGCFHVNGLYRHGFLLAPALARLLADQFSPIFKQETGDENNRKFHPA
ncbi:glycine oxidase [Pacificibacter maritimus]|uniref:Glycine oxidase n=1 Tax=Pacificibacter maritimus TaxID=762213 RepID=A0A3N4ULP7_9RHOB|nr:FAD-dependent oxidoreductase [Pacificibacter maritimus]RPE71522.1 glycine oxidase [Pacificibacter maritimus]